MEKLVELLNKFEKEKIINNWWSVDEDDEYFWRSIENWKIVNWDYDPDAHSFMKYYIFSKDFEFVERLFKTEKVDNYKLYDAFKTENRDFRYTKDDKSSLEQRIDVFIMLLNISKDPMKILFQILK